MGPKGRICQVKDVGFADASCKIKVLKLTGSLLCSKDFVLVFLLQLMLQSMDGGLVKAVLLLPSLPLVTP